MRDAAKMRFGKMRFGNSRLSGSGFKVQTKILDFKALGLWFEGSKDGLKLDEFCGSGCWSAGAGSLRLEESAGSLSVEGLGTSSAGLGKT